MDKIFIFFQCKDIVSVSVQTDIGVIVFTVIAYKNIFISSMDSGADPGFQFSGAHLKKLRQAEGGANIVGVFRVENHDFTPKNHMFSNYRGGGGGGARRVPPPPPTLDPPPPPHWIRPWD